ncbi:MAG: branched-chain amino acid aminotransferase [Clostridia bacterium]|nr:branched-chain amino acid aminotransferase [Clostridia bacterium]
MEIKICRNPSPKKKPEGPLGFGRIFTDHMFVMDYTAGQGWHDARIVPYGPLELDPSSMVFHYAQEIFEGLKAYRTASGEIRLFRPYENARRMNNSADRLCMPQIDPEDWVGAVKALVELEKDWVPYEKGTSLYIRPFMIATDAQLGVHPSKTYKFIIILSPVGSYYAGGLDPVRIYIETKYVRAVRGGTGEAKTGGNYAASIKSQEISEELGYSQVLWLDGVEQKYIEEVGAMNVFFKIAGKIVTPALVGSILPGITRKSAIELLRDWGYEVEERRLSAEEVEAAAKSGLLEEMFGTGTAAVISPVGELLIGDTHIKINEGKIGPVSQKLYDTMTGIQWGTIEDTKGWITKI